MKILWVFSTFAIGGPQRRAAEVISRLGPEHEHVIIALDRRHEAEVFLPPNARWQIEDARFEKSGFVSLANLQEIRRALSRVAPDLLLTSNWGSIEWAIANRGAARRPHIHFEDGFGPDESASLQNWKRALTRRVVLADTIVAVPSAVLRDVALRRWGLSERNVVLLENGVDVARYRTAPRGARSVVVVGSLGALRGEKNYPRLARAVAAARQNTGLDIRLKIHGDGPERSAIEKVASGAHWLELPGPTSAPQSALKDFDLFALSSDTEQAPLSLMEAMASGLAVAATDVGDIARMVAPENRSFVTPLGDDAALSDAIGKLAANPDLRARLGASNAAKATAEFAAESMVAAHAALYDRAIRA